MCEDTTLILQSPDWRLVGICVLWGASIALFVSAFLTLFPMPEWLISSYQADSEAIFVRTDLILSIVLIGVLAPLLEELVFRGYMLERLMPYFTEKQAVWITTVIFAGFHAQLLWMLYAGIMGYLLATLALKKDNLLYAICLHIGFNAPALINAGIHAAGLGDALFFSSKFLIIMYGGIGAVTSFAVYRELKREEEL